MLAWPVTGLAGNAKIQRHGWSVNKLFVRFLRPGSVTPQAGLHGCHSLSNGIVGWVDKSRVTIIYKDFAKVEAQDLTNKLLFSDS